jgi:hypothetical protein
MEFVFEQSTTQVFLNESCAPRRLLPVRKANFFIMSCFGDDSLDNDMGERRSLLGNQAPEDAIRSETWPRILGSTSSKPTLCSYEHEQPNREIFSTASSTNPSSPTGIEFMAETSPSLRRVLEQIRDDAQKALNLLGNKEEVRSLSWKCTTCDHVKHFTRPVSAGVARPCPKCGANSFQSS